METEKESFGSEVAKEVLIQREYDREVNDYIFLKLATTYDVEGKPMNGYETVEAQICPGKKTRSSTLFRGGLNLLVGNE